MIRIIEKDTSLKTKLLGSAPTEEGIKELMAKFWYDKPDNIRILWDKEFEGLGIIQKIESGKQITGCRVIKKGGRYRFEMILPN